MSEQQSIDPTEAPDAAAPAYEPNPEATEPGADGPSGMGTFAEDGSYIPRSITEDDIGGMSMDDAYTATMVEVEDGQIVEGT
ncbi:MAG: hypothetical protein ACXWCM_07670, partial [Acidimicrobiales bacterium]